MHELNKLYSLYYFCNYRPKYAKFDGIFIFTYRKKYIKIDCQTFKILYILTDI